MNSLVLHLAGPGQAPFPDLATALRIAANALAELPGTEVEIVVQGPSVTRLAAPAEDSARITELLGTGRVAISACANSLRSAGVEVSELAPGVRDVPAAIAQLARRQGEGAAYIRI